MTQALDRTMEDYARLNEILGNGKKIQAPSDDVTGMMRALDYRVSISDNTQFQRNIDQASNSLNFTNTVLTSLVSTLGNVKQLAISAMSGTLDAQEQAILGQQARQFRDQLLDLGNAKYLNQYLFSGYRTDLQPYAAGTYAYQGDSGVMNVMIAQGSAVPVNVTGTSTLSYTLAAPMVQQISSGNYVHYTPGAGTTVNVEIRDSTDTAVLDTFSFSNIIQMTDLLSTAIGANNTRRIQALATPFDQAQNQLATTQADVGSRLVRLKDQTTWLTQSTNTTKNSLSSVEDADMNDTAVKLQKTNVALQALYAASSKIMSMSLFDFLK
jgi:flagellar hook-associated protein 3 FlgL